MADIPIPDDVVASEFAAVTVSIDRQGNGPRLRLEDLRGERVVFFDALELETLVWLPPGLIERLHDPSLSRWRDPHLDAGITAELAP